MHTHTPFNVLCWRAVCAAVAAAVVGYRSFLSPL